MPGGRGMRHTAVTHLAMKTKKQVRNGYHKIETQEGKEAGSLEQIVKSITSPDKHDPSFAVLEENDASVVLDRIERIEKIISLKKEMVASQLDDGRDEVELEKKLTGLLEKVESRISHARHYLVSVSLVFFCAIYAYTLILQTNNDASCSVEGAIINNFIYALPGGIQGGFLSSTDDFWTFMNTTLINSVFVNPSCGDGVCSLPIEYPGFGRFGCIPDCGRFVQTTTITVDLRSFIYDQSQYSASEIPCDNNNPSAPCRYLGGVKQSNITNPRFQYNIFSNTMNDYIFANDLDVNNVQRVEVPDGEFRLELYQSQKTSQTVDQISMYTNLYVVPNTIPARTAATDYFYGDRREYLAVTSALLTDISTFCWGASQATHNYACDWHPTLDTVITALGSYGISGSITMSAGMRKSTTLVSVSYCSVLPNGTLGLSASKNRDILQSFGMTCPSQRRQLSGNGDLRAKHATAVDTNQHLRAGLPVGSHCTKASDCDQTVIDPFSNKPGTFCGASGVCNYCSFCQNEGIDSFDGRCLAICNQSGNFPECLDATRLTASLSKATCQSEYPFRIYRYNPDGVMPTVLPPPVPSMPEITPHNFIVGPITVTQIRKKQKPCSEVQSYSMRLFSNRTNCSSSEVDDAAYGVDATFLSASDIYNGKLKKEDFYNESEMYTTSTYFPSGAVFTEKFAYGFFPHKYDAVTHTTKNDALILEEEKNAFKLYFDGLLTLNQANNMLFQMEEGGFIDQSTASIDVDFITFNPDLNVFSTITIFFEWKVGGSISWDFKQHTQGFDVYAGPGGGVQRGLEIFCVVLLAIYMAIDLWSVVGHLRKSRFLSLLKFGRLLDWTHWGLMVFVWTVWFHHVRLASQFTMMSQSDYWVLSNPGAPARLFQTNATTEHNFLKFQKAVNEYIYDSGEYYNSVCSCSIILFVLRVLKSFGFQIHLGVITRTFASASNNLIHFMALIFAVFIGFSMAGHLIFGHEFQQMSTLGDSMVQHFWMMLTLDATTFYDMMYHAAPPWIFHCYCWSFVIMCGFLLINIFLAILVDAYMEVRSKALSSKTLLDDVTDVLTHAAKTLLLNKRIFMSDWELQSCLYRVLNQTQQQKTVLPQKAQVLELLMNSLHKNDRALHLPGGVEINGATLSHLAKEVGTEALKSSEAPFSVADGKDPSGGEPSGALEPWVDEIMERYADPINAIKLEQSVVADIRAEGLKRDLFTYRAHQRIHDAVVKVSALLDLLAGKVLSPAELRATRLVDDTPAGEEDLSELLQVSVLEAQMLPRKDVIRSVDPFCLLCLVADKDDPTGRQTFKTRVMAGDRNPKWNEHFIFPMPEESKDSPVLTVVILDYDRCSTNDLIGCVSVDVKNQVPKAPGFLEDWFPVVNKHDRASVKQSRLRLKLERLGKVQRDAARRAERRASQEAPPKEGDRPRKSLEGERPRKSIEGERPRKSTDGTRLPPGAGSGNDQA